MTSKKNASSKQSISSKKSISSKQRISSKQKKHLKQRTSQLTASQRSQAKRQSSKAFHVRMHANYMGDYMMAWHDVLIDFWRFFEFVKVCWIRFSSWESFIDFYIWCYPISTILACLFTVGVRISWKKLCWKGRNGGWGAIFVWRVNLRILPRKFVWAWRTTTPNCRVSFIELYVVFPTDF